MMRPNRTISDMAWQAGLMQSTHAPNPEGLNILCLIHDSVTACEEYRVIQPMQEMERAGHNVYLMNATAHAARLKQRIDDTVGADLVLVNRINTEEGMENVYNVVMQNIRKRGTSGVVDFDDDFRNVHREVHPGVMPALDRFSAITVTTDVLKTAYGGLNKHIYVLPNLIQLERFDKAPREINGLVIGLTGSQTHRLDWQPAAAALRRILDEHPEVKGFVSGYMPAELKGHPQVLTPGMVRKEYIADSDLLVPYKHYPWVVKQIDILLCPVDPEDRFNWYKSPLKVLEGWAAGCAVIATGPPLPIYSTVMTPDTGLLTFHTEEGYYNALKYLVERPDVTAFLRESGRKEAQKWASEHVNRERIYRTIIDRDRRKLERQKEWKQK